MKPGDIIGLAFANLWRTKLRTALTTLGVVIGIGALSSMISFGTGMQKNITDAFEKNDLLTAIYVTAQKIDLREIAQGDVTGILNNREAVQVPLNDSTLNIIRNMEGVEIAYPEMTFQARIKILGRDRKVTAVALPWSMRQYSPFDHITYGNFFENDSSATVILNWNGLRRMNMLVVDPGHPVNLTDLDRKKGLIPVSADSLIGKPIYITTAVLDIPSLFLGALGVFGAGEKFPVKEVTTPLIIGGIVKNETPFNNPNLKGDILVPFKTAGKIPKLAVNNILDILSGGHQPGTYSSIYLRVKNPGQVELVASRLKNMHFNVLALSDQLKEIARQFLLMDGFLAAIGTIALVVAGLGIMNTMIMSILERTREIGIMKAIGGSEPQIRLIFFVEAGVIGFAGAIFGLILGWLVTVVANKIANMQLLPLGEGPVNFFYFPMWLITGSVLFSVILSLLAGVYPAYRAARVDPVKALRHD